MDRLEELRSRIDAVDTRMAELFCERMETVREIAAYKQERNLPVLDSARERIMIERNCAAYPDSKTRKSYEAFLKAVLEASRSYQLQWMQDQNEIF